MNRPEDRTHEAAQGKARLSLARSRAGRNFDRGNLGYIDPPRQPAPEHSELLVIVNP